MFKRFGVFGLVLAAAATAFIQPAVAFGQDRFDRGYAYHDRDDRRRFEGDRDYYRDRQWREREAREHTWREHDRRERERYDYRGYNYNNYAPNYYGDRYCARPY